MSQYTNAAQQRVMALTLYLFHDVVNGYSPGALAKALNVAASAITRDLANLAEAGLVERDESTGHWRLTPRLPQQALKAIASIDRAERRVAEARQRFTRTV